MRAPACGPTTTPVFTSSVGKETTVAVALLCVWPIIIEVSRQRTAAHTRHPQCGQMLPFPSSCVFNTQMQGMHLCTQACAASLCGLSSHPQAVTHVGGAQQAHIIQHTPSLGP